MLATITVYIDFKNTSLQVQANTATEIRDKVHNFLTWVPKSEQENKKLTLKQQEKSKLCPNKNQNFVPMKLSISGESTETCIYNYTRERERERERVGGGEAMKWH